jgi:hypothetical protein
VEVRRRLRQVYLASSRAACEAARDELVSWLRRLGQTSAAETLLRDWDDFVRLYDFPIEHWRHLRTSNPVESVIPRELQLVERVPRLRTQPGKSADLTRDLGCSRTRPIRHATDAPTALRKVTLRWLRRPRQRYKRPLLNRLQLRLHSGWDRREALLLHP